RCSSPPTARRRAPSRRCFRCCRWTASTCATARSICRWCCRAGPGPTCPTTRRWRRSCISEAFIPEEPSMDSHWTEGNDIRLLENGEAFYPRVFTCIANARREVLVETFILFEDGVGLQ